MVDNVSCAKDVYNSILQSKWSKCGVCGFLIGRKTDNKVDIHNIWINSDDQLMSSFLCCKGHLCSDICHVPVIRLVCKCFQKHMSRPTLLCFLCSENGKPASVLFHALLDDGSTIRPVNVTFRDMDVLDHSLVLFRLQSGVPFCTNLSHARDEVIQDDVLRLICGYALQSGRCLEEKQSFCDKLKVSTWREKLDKEFRSVLSELSDRLTYRIRDTKFIMSSDGLTGCWQSVSTVKQLVKILNNNDDAYRSPAVKSIGQSSVLLDMYYKISGTSGQFSHPVCAPALIRRHGNFITLNMTLPVDVVLDVEPGMAISALVSALSDAVAGQLDAVKSCLLRHFSQENGFLNPVPYHFLVPRRPTRITVFYPETIPDKQLVHERLLLHQRMCLRLDRPAFRRGSRCFLPGEVAPGGYIVNPHVGLPPSGDCRHSERKDALFGQQLMGSGDVAVKGGSVHLVSGNYTYHHYRQDRCNDDAWGCAYRSLQTLISWYRYQGYTEAAIPTHRQIQQALVDVGDKTANFVGSKKWIGSFEVSYVLKHLLEVTSKFLSVSSGKELADVGRELFQHFDVHGTPVMIGGGVLAHTILGVDYNELTGELRFLVLDPHYTGGEDIRVIQCEGWCDWKGVGFWNPTAHYNLCMPQKPDDGI